LADRYRASDKITFARCNVQNVPLASNVDRVPTIKIFPAKKKYLPVEYHPSDPSFLDGYISFIEEEGSNHLKPSKDDK
jgi:hypothetical protein